MNIRTFHRRLALVSAPFLLLTSCTGLVLLFRKDELYSKATKEFLLGLHNWEYGAKYIGAILAFALIGICLSGIMLFLKTKKF